MATTQDGLDAHDERSSEEIRDDIVETRREMDDTLDDLGERLHPRNLLNDLLDLLRPDGRQSGATAATAQRMMKGVGRTVRDNPGPALLMGAGAAWALMNAASDDDSYSGVRRHSYASRSMQANPGEVLTDADRRRQPISGSRTSSSADLKRRAQASGEQAKESMANAADTASEKLKDFGDQASETASEWREQAADSAERVQQQVQEQYAQASDQFEAMVEESPLLVGAGFLAAGILAGIVLPRTRQEDRWMGEASDELAERGKKAVTAVASRAAAKAKEEGLDVDTLAAKAGRVADKVTASAAEAAREEGVAPSDLKKKAAGVAQSAKSEAKDQAQPDAKKQSDGKGRPS